MKKDEDEAVAGRFARRTFLRGTGGAIAAASLVPHQAVGALTQNDAEVPARTPIEVTINGATQRLEVEDRWTLVELLRDELELTGTRVGCDRGECGACTVLMDGRPVYSCSQLAAWVDGADITTVEGLEENGRLSPIQQAFVDGNGPQCGFCTSGQIMAATGLLDKNASPSREEVRHSLSGNLCRCSNYNAIVESVLAAAGAPVTADPPPRVESGFSSLGTVGPATPRIDAMERVTGRAAYTGDVRLPGMIYGRVLRSPHPHARVRRIDVSKAVALPGVQAVITNGEAPIVWGAGSVSGGRQYDDRIKAITKHRRPLFDNPVKFVGAPVAAVAAVDRHVAEEALRLIEVE
ncbi:MAG: 2Fe-2S iron-sulfur cluster-binding protein, partial [Acidobacteriota bacterium]|nr:2Fe-2S iron-sulfur cluster-binding protein [Acidobacteriota bacterium]